MKWVGKYLGLATADLFPVASRYRHSKVYPCAGLRNSCETECLAETVDRLTAVACQRAVDKIAQRFQSLEMVVSDRSWEIGTTWSSYHHPTSGWRPARKNRIPRTTSNKRHRASPKSKGKGTFPVKEQPKLVAFHLHDTERCDLPRNSRLTSTFSLHRTEVKHVSRRPLHLRAPPAIKPFMTSYPSGVHSLRDKFSRVQRDRYSMCSFGATTALHSLLALTL